MIPKASRWILVIEDNPSDFVLLQIAVGGVASKQLRHLANGEQALELFDNLEESAPDSLPDVIILDLNLPRIDGFQVVARIQSDEALRQMAILILTSSESPSERIRALKEGADVYCTKPMDLEGYLRLPEVIEEAREHRDRRITGGKMVPSIGAEQGTGDGNGKE